MSNVADAIIILWGWRRLAVALVAGALSALAQAPFDAFPLLWLTVPVFVWLIDGATAGERAGPIRRLAPAFAVGWTFGFGYFVAGLWWIGAAFLVDADQFAWLMPFAVIALPAGLALFWGIGAAVARAMWPEGWTRIVVFAVVFTIVEWLRALARKAHAECGGKGVGAVGMCFTGGYALAMMTEPAVVAPVLSQRRCPALPCSCIP